MKKIAYCLIVSTAAFTSALLSSCSKTEPPVATTPTYKIVWQDEFDNTGLPLASNWGYEEGFVRNSEKQFYTKQRIENAHVENGILTIEGRKENYNGAAYTSASINTKGKQSWTYGKIEVRAKLPEGSGSWPAIWMLGNNVDIIDWPRCGEIDIMEAVGKEPGMLYSTVHYGNLWPDAKNKSGNIYNKTTYSDYHIYSVEWTADQMSFYIDSNNYFTFNKTNLISGYPNPFDKPFFLLLNLAIGGAWGGGNPAFPPDGIDTSSFSQKFMIDYVRVYQKL